MTVTAMPTKPMNVEAGGLVLDLSESQISPTYAVCLSNILETQKDCCISLRIPRRRSRPSIEDAKGTDCNAFSRRGSCAVAEHSPRMFRIEGWTLANKASTPSDPGPREGQLKKRSVPRPEERMCFPNIIREDKIQQKWLEMKRNIKTTIQVMEIAREEHAAGPKRKVKEQKHQKLLRRFQRSCEVKQLAIEAMKELEQLKIEREIDLVVLGPTAITEATAVKMMETLFIWSRHEGV